jgi:hypothetical protein
VIEVSAMGSEHGIAETLYYPRRDRLFEGGKGARAGFAVANGRGLGREEPYAHGPMRFVGLSIRH